MLLIPLIYNDGTKILSVDEEYAGTTIDDKSTSFTVSGIPTDAIDARLDVKVAIKTCKGHKIRPFMRLDIDSGTGTCTVPLDLLRATKRDLKFIIQLVITTENESYASANWLTFKVSPAIASLPSQEPLTDLGQLFINAEGDSETQCIIFDRVNGDTDIVDVKPLVINDETPDYDHAFSSQKTLDIIDEYASVFAGKYKTHADLIKARIRPDGKNINLNDYAIVENDKPAHPNEMWRYVCIDEKMIGTEDAWAAEYRITNENAIPINYVAEKIDTEPQTVLIKSETERLLPKWRVESANHSEWMAISDGAKNAVRYNDGTTEMSLDSDSLRMVERRGNNGAELNKDGLIVSKDGKTLNVKRDSIDRNGDAFYFALEEGNEDKVILKPEWMEAGKNISIKERTEEGVRRPGIVIDSEGSKVIAHTERATGVRIVKSLQIDDEVWNLPEGGGGGAGTKVVPSEAIQPSGRALRSLMIDDEPWNLPAEHISVSLDRAPAIPGQFVGDIEDEDYQSMIRGVPVIWTFGNSLTANTIITNDLVISGNKCTITADAFDDEGKYTFYGTIENEGDKHTVIFVQKEKEIEVALTIVSQTEFTGTLKDGDIEKLRNGDATLKATFEAEGITGCFKFSDFSTMDAGEVSVMAGIGTMADGEGRLWDIVIMDDKSVKITMHSGGGTEVRVDPDRVEGQPSANSISINGHVWNLATEVIPSENVHPQSKTVKSFLINDEHWNIDTKVSNINMYPSEEDPNLWVGNVSADKFKKIITGQFMNILFGNHPTILSAVLTGLVRSSTDKYRIHAIAIGDDGKETRLAGELEGGNGDNHVIKFSFRNNEIEISETLPQTAPIARCITLHGKQWALPTGTGGDAVWGGITGDIDNQADLKARLNGIHERINDAIERADDAQDDADDAHDLAVAAQSTASIASAAIGELEVRVEFSIAPAITALEGAVAGIEGDLATKASQASVDAVNERVDAIRTELDELKRKVQENTNRIDNIFQFIDEVRSRYVFTEAEQP